MYLYESVCIVCISVCIYCICMYLYVPAVPVPLAPDRLLARRREGTEGTGVQQPRRLLRPCPCLLGCQSQSPQDRAVWQDGSGFVPSLPTAGPDWTSHSR